MRYAILCVTLVSGAAWGEEGRGEVARVDRRRAERTWEHRHRGFFLRMNAGPGYFAARSTEADVDVNGGGATLGVAIGGAIEENLILYGEAFGSGADHPVFAESGAARGVDSATLVGVGPGFAWYLMPLNLYLSGSAVLTSVVVDPDADVVDDERQTEPGLGVNLMVGKEWWVSNNWGLGVAAQMALAGGMKQKDEREAEWRAIGFGLVFSATYN